MLVIMHNATMNTEFRYLFEMIFFPFGYTPRRMIAESYGSSIFNFLRLLPTIFHSSWNSFHFQCPSVFFSPNLEQHLLTLVFLIIDTLRSMRWYLIVVLIYVSLMISDVEYLFMNLSIICILLWQNVFSDSLPIF